ncbi:MAG: PPC domain-containing protein [Gemmataceae bacterium]|nr:PPC domain-containing protein [Gemmataceae bacterium]
MHTRTRPSRRLFRTLCLLCALRVLCGESSLRADPPVASFIFPAGGPRGQTVNLRVGGLNLNQSCGFEMLGRGVEVEPRLQRMKRIWFEGPVLPLPESQQAEDYPQDMAGKVKIAADAPLGPRPWRLWTSQGATPALKFMVGDLPEIIEQEIEGEAVPVEVRLPVTINGRIFPREKVGIWSFPAKKGETISGEVWASRLGSPLDSRVEIRDPEGRRIAENDDCFGADSFVRFTAPADGRYEIRIHDVQHRGGPAYVYRLTLTADAAVDRAYPLGGRRGTTAKFELTGQGLAKEPMGIQLPADAPRDFVHRITVNGKLTNPFVLDLDDLHEYLEAEPNDAPEKAMRVDIPSVSNGRIDKPGDIDTWTFTGKKGEALELDLRAQRLGSPLHAILSISDEAGKELAQAVGDDRTQSDPVLRFTPPADGTYIVRVKERFQALGGPDYAYRLRITASTAPDFRLTLGTDAVTLVRGGQLKLRVNADRLGNFVDAIALEIDGLPEGVTVTGNSIAAKQATTEITFKAEATSRIQAARLTIRGKAKVGDSESVRTATLPLGRGMMELDTVLCSVAMPTPFKIVGDHDMRWAPRGSVFTRRYRIERNGFDGPLEISLADRQARHLQGATGPTITVPAGAAEFDYSVNLAPWMETARTCRVCVMATAVVKDTDGSEHVVTFSSQQPNEQIIVVVEPERLGLSAAKPSLTAAPGKNVEVPLRVQRAKGLDGVVKLELIVPAHLQGIAADAVEVKPGEDRPTLTLRFAEKLTGPFNAPLVIRATMMDRGKPVIAETKIELQPADR